MIRVPFFLIFWSNKGTIQQKEQKGTTLEPRARFLAKETSSLPRQLNEGRKNGTKKRIKEGRKEGADEPAKERRKDGKKKMKENERVNKSMKL